MAYTGTSVAGGEGNATFHATSKLDFLGKELEIFTVDFVDLRWTSNMCGFHKESSKSPKSKVNAPGIKQIKLFMVLIHQPFPNMEILV